MFRIFYSWISDPAQKRNRMLVYRALSEALQKVSALLDASQDSAEVIQCERFKQPIDIARYIVETIATCHALVGDISYINHPREKKTRPTPNPNAMFEIGMATQCLGPGKVILVFNTDSGRAAQLPFDVRNQVVLTWSSSDSHAKLARALQDPIETIFRDYLALGNQFALDFDRCLTPLLDFLEQFMTVHIESQRPGFTAASMALFNQGPDGKALLPQTEYLEPVLREYQRQLLAAPSSVDGLTEGNLFAIILQRLHDDGERLTYRYQALRESNLFREVEQLSTGAGHLERLVERVVNRVPDLMINSIIVDEILGFLRHVVGVRRELARYVSRPLIL